MKPNQARQDLAASVLQRKMDDFRGELMELDQNLKELIEAISPALSPIVDATASEEPVEATPPISGVSLWVLDQTRFVEELNRTLRSVRERIEL